MNWIFIAVHGLLVAVACGAQALRHVGFSTCGLISLVACGIFPDRGLNLVLLHCRQILYQLSYQGNPISLLGGWQRGGKSTQKNYTKKIFMTQITMLV